MHAAQPERIARPKIHAAMNVMDAIALHEGAGDVLAEYGLHCFQCAFNTMDSLEAGAKTHGLTDTDIENMVIDLQDLINASPLRDPVITLTPAAAEALKTVAASEGKTSATLRVANDGKGGFCMEFDEKTSGDDRMFVCAGIDGVSVVASSAVLWRTGGSTIDFRGERFKLDLPGSSTCGCAGKGCTCKSGK